MFTISGNPAWFRRLPICLLVASWAVLLGSEIATCHAQEIKEIPSDHGISGKQPEVYWHDADSKIDLAISTEQLSVVIKQGSGPAKRVLLPNILAQVDSIRRASADRIVVLADLSAGAHYVGVIGTNPAKVIDEFWTSAPPVLSPDNRWVLFVRFYPMHGADGYDDQYRLYDVLGNRTANWPGRPAQDGPSGGPTNYDASKAGIPAYPLDARELDRDNTNVPEGEEHHSLSPFVWDANSKRVLFADEAGGKVSLVMVAMPTGKRLHPETRVYMLSPDQSPCSELCQRKNVEKLEWNGDAVKVRLLATPNSGPDRETTLNLPVSQFVAAAD